MVVTPLLASLERATAPSTGTQLTAVDGMWGRSRLDMSIRVALGYRNYVLEMSKLDVKERTEQYPFWLSMTDSIFEGLP